MNKDQATRTESVKTKLDLLIIKTNNIIRILSEGNSFFKAWNWYTMLAVDVIVVALIGFIAHQGKLATCLNNVIGLGEACNVLKWITSVFPVVFYLSTSAVFLFDFINLIKQRVYTSTVQRHIDNLVEYRSKLEEYSNHIESVYETLEQRMEAGETIDFSHGDLEATLSAEAKYMDEYKNGEMDVVFPYGIMISLSIVSLFCTLTIASALVINYFIPGMSWSILSFLPSFFSFVADEVGVHLQLLIPLGLSLVYAFIFALRHRHTHDSGVYFSPRHLDVDATDLLGAFCSAMICITFVTLLLAAHLALTAIVVIALIVFLRKISRR